MKMKMTKHTCILLGKLIIIMQIFSMGKLCYGFSFMQVGHPHSDKSLKGKSACTKFTRISTDGTHSVVLCEPTTGRTHQVINLGFVGSWNYS